MPEVFLTGYYRLGAEDEWANGVDRGMRRGSFIHARGRFTGYTERDGGVAHAFRSTVEVNGAVWVGNVVI